MDKHSTEGAMPIVVLPAASTATVNMLIAKACHPAPDCTLAALAELSSQRAIAAQCLAAERLLKAGMGLQLFLEQGLYHFLQQLADEVGTQKDPNLKCILKY